jgi:GMP synthase (glutamine-hydrolysing)
LVRPASVGPPISTLEGPAVEPRAPRVLLLQIRDHAEAERQERRCFVEVSGLPPERFRFHNLLERPALTLDDAEDADVVVIGGAGSHSVTGEHAFDRPLARFVERWVELGRPLFGSCYGHQFVAQALGGRVETDLARKEIGSFDVALTPAGESDPLFAGLPPRFTVQLGHHDRVTELPPGAIELARSELCPVQAYRLVGRPVWGCQFHVELDERGMLERAGLYRAGYLPGDALERLRTALRPSPVASTLFARFLAIAAGELAAPATREPA